MPQSKKRHHAHPQQHHPHNSKQAAKKFNKLITVVILFFGLLGMFVSYFIADADIAWIIVGTLLGAAGGYLIGREMDKSLSKK